MARKTTPEDRQEQERADLQAVTEEANEPTGPPALETAKPVKPERELQETFRGQPKGHAERTDR